MICNNCGAEIPEDSVFCTNCGSSLENQTEEVVETITDAEITEAPVEDPGKLFGIISLSTGAAGAVLSLLGIVANFVPCLINSCCSGLLCGLGCLIGCFSTVLPLAGALLGAICGIVAIVFGILGMNKSKSVDLKNQFALIGLILGIVALVLALGGLVLIPLSTIITPYLTNLLAAFGLNMSTYNDYASSDYYYYGY